MRATFAMLMAAVLIAWGGTCRLDAQGQASTGSQDPPGQAPAASAATQNQAPAGSGDKPAQPATSAEEGGLAGLEGWVDLGFRASSVDGDRARFERYQDLRDKGLNLDAVLSKEGPSWLFEASAKNVGYHDQQYAASFSAMGKLSANFSFTQLPLNYGFADDGFVRTPYDGTLHLDPNTRARTAAGTAVAWTANPTQTSAWAPLAQPIDLGSRRDTLNVGLVYSATKAIDVNVGVNSYSRTGNQPWGASWGFSNAAELAQPLDNRTTDFTLGVGWSQDRAGVNLAFDHSSFSNNNEILTWDNPGTNVDSLAKGAAQGREMVFPSNSMSTVRGSGVYKFPRRTSVVAAFAVGTQKQDEALIPPTTNTLLGLSGPERATAQAEADISMFTVSVNSRPIPKLWLTGRFRYHDYTTKTPDFTQTEAVFDTSISGPDTTEPLNVSHKVATFAASYQVLPYATARFDFIHEGIDQTVREWPHTSENTERISVDSVGNQFVTLRASYDHSVKRGSGTSELEVAEVDPSQQPATRMFDVADRTTNRGTVMLTATPTPSVGVSVSVAAGKDNYDDPLQQFGLLDNKNQVYTVGVDYAPTDKISAGIAYGWQKYEALSASRNANPLPDPTFNDPNRNWTDNQSERVHTVTANLVLLDLVEKTELRFGYDYSHSDQSYLYSGPAIARLQGLPAAAFATGFTSQFAPLPDVVNGITRLTANARYYFTKHLAVDVTYWFDKYSVDDFATPIRLDPPGSLLLGYGFRPYTGHTGFFNVLYRF